MPYPKIKYWRKFSDDIVSVSEEEGLFLHHFIRQRRMDETLFDNYEILDFQRYRTIRKRSKIAGFFHLSRKERRFKFLISKN